MINLSKLKQHIKKRKRKGLNLNLLGLVENQDLTPEVESLFIFSSPSGYVGYDWVNGNDKLKQLVSVL